MMFAAVDLSRFTCLRRLYLHFYEEPDEKILTHLNAILSSITSCQLEELYIRPGYHPPRLLDSTIAALTGLRDVDAILSHPRFHRLSHFRFPCQFFVTMQELPATSNTTSHTSNTMVLVPGLSSKPSTDDNDNGRDARDAFERHVKDLVRCKIQEELKQLNARDILDIELLIVVEEKQ